MSETHKVLRFDAFELDTAAGELRRAGERIKLTRYNKTIAVVIPKKDLTDLEECEKSRAQAEATPGDHPKRGGHGHGRHHHDEKP